MHVMRWAAVTMLGTMALAGCTKKVEPPPGPYVPPPGITQDTRERMLKQNPDVVFGSVVAVRTEDQLAAVADIPVDQFKSGDTVAFYAGDQVVNVGQVLRAVNGNLHVRYNAPGVGQRAPQVGDFAVMFKPLKQ